MPRCAFWDLGPAEAQPTLASPAQDSIMQSCCRENWQEGSIIYCSEGLSG